MKILLTGANGQLGHCFQDRLPVDWAIQVTDSSELDITDKDAVLTAVQKFKPDVIVNAAAYTAVDKAESEPEVALRINATGPENLALAAKAIGARLVHVSTDYVFDGQSSTPYKETDKTNPLGVYGSTKLEGEKAVEAILPDAIIIRTAWVFSEYGNNFVKTMIRLGKDRDTLGIVADQRGCPTYAGDIASTIITMIDHDAPGGIYHYCGDREVSWYEFAEEIFSAAVNEEILPKSPVLNALTTAQYPTPASRPAYSTLDTSKISRYCAPSDWFSQLPLVVKS